MQPCRDRLWKPGLIPAGSLSSPPQAFQGQRARWTSEVPSLCCLLWSQGLLKPCRTHRPPPTNTDSASHGPQTCPLLSRSLAPDVTCPPWDSLQPTTFSQSISDALKCADAATWLSPDTFRKQGLQGLPTHPEDLGRWQPHLYLCSLPSLSPPPHHGSLPPVPGFPLPSNLTLWPWRLLLCTLPQASWALSSHPPGTCPLHSKRPPMCLVLLSEEPLALGTGEHPLPRSACRSLWWGRGTDGQLGVDLLWERGSRVAKGAKSHGWAVALSPQLPPRPRSEDSPSGSVSPHQLLSLEKGPLPGTSLLGLRPGGRGRGTYCDGNSSCPAEQGLGESCVHGVPIAH